MTTNIIFPKVSQCYFVLGGYHTLEHGVERRLSLIGLIVTLLTKTE